MVQLTWSETRDIMESLEALYSDGADVAEANKVRALHSEAEREAARRAADARHIIKEITARVAHKEAALSWPLKDELAANCKRLQEEAEVLRDGLERSVAVAAHEEAALAATRSKVDAADAAILDAASQHATDMPRVQNAISLYANVSGIRWHYDCDPEHLAGWISAPESDAVQAFVFDLVSEDRFSIANRLWSLMDETTAVAVASAAGERAGHGGRG
ncbi:unnamed protein product [Phaeothamnion confervicola]